MYTGQSCNMNGECHEWKDLPKAVQQQYTKTVADLQKTILDIYPPCAKKPGVQPRAFR